MRQKLERFDRIPVPTLYEIYEAQHDTGTFQQVGGPYIDQDMASRAFDELLNFPEMASKKLFVVEVRRAGIITNFDAREIGRLEGETSN